MWHLCMKVPQSVAVGKGSAVDRACCCTCCRTILAKKDAKVVTEADAEEMEFWYQLEDDYEIISFKAWNAVMSQVQPSSSCEGRGVFPYHAEKAPLRSMGMCVSPAYM